MTDKANERRTELLQKIANGGNNRQRLTALGNLLQNGSKPLSFAEASVVLTSCPDLPSEIQEAIVRQLQYKN